MQGPLKAKVHRGRPHALAFCAHRIAHLSTRFPDPNGEPGVGAQASECNPQLPFARFQIKYDRLPFGFRRNAKARTNHSLWSCRRSTSRNQGPRQYAHVKKRRITESPTQGSARHSAWPSAKTGQEQNLLHLHSATGNRESCSSCGAGGDEVGSGSDGPYLVRTVSVTIGVQL
jgi:hypothetical protein